MKIFSGPSLFAFILGSLALSGCSLAPDYKAPETPPVPAYKETGEWTPAKPADEIQRGDWWRMFGDAQLDALEDQVTAANQDLKAALAQYEEARAAVGVARADYFPTITGSAGASRGQISANVANRPPVRLANDYILGASLNYEVDIWGRVRNEVAANQGQADATKADLATISLSLHALLASDYFALRGDDAMQNILDQTVQVDEKALELTRNRFKGGASPEVDVDQSETQLENARTQAADTRLQRAQLEHAIAVLTGHVPSDFHLASSPLGDADPPAINPGMPSTLLERRPDIAAAERRAYAANAEIGVARAAWFPTFSLTGSFGYESAATGSWFDAPSHFWSLGPQAVMTLFDGGRIESLTEEAHAAYDEAAADYRQTVLAAYQDVEDNLASLHHLADENRSQAAATAASMRSLAQERNLYTGGVVTYLDVATAETVALQAQLALVNVHTRRLTAATQLVKSLGGGWQQEPAN